MSVFPELVKVIQELHYPTEYYTYCIKNGVDNYKCLALIIENNYINYLNQIPFGHWIMLKHQILLLKQSQSNLSQSNNNSCLRSQNSQTETNIISSKIQPRLSLTSNLIKFPKNKSAQEKYRTLNKKQIDMNTNNNNNNNNNNKNTDKNN
eukprot:388318_1